MKSFYRRITIVSITIAVVLGVLFYTGTHNSVHMDEDVPLEAEPVSAAVHDPDSSAGGTDGSYGRSIPSDWKVPVADVEQGSIQTDPAVSDGTVGISILPASTISESAELPVSAMLQMESILQEPELPTGCESIALTMALSSLGFSLSKTEIVEHYLYYSNNIVLGYVGDPYSDEGAGIYAPGLVRTANRFLDSADSPYSAYDASGFELDDLLHFIAAGHPVIIWTTMYFEEPWMSEDFFEFNGQIYPWYWNEHCVALQGYDLGRNMLILQDPLQGQVEIDKDLFQGIYDEIGRYAITIY